MFSVWLCEEALFSGCGCMRTGSCVFGRGCVVETVCDFVRRLGVTNPDMRI